MCDKFASTIQTRRTQTLHCSNEQLLHILSGFVDDILKPCLIDAFC